MTEYNNVYADITGNKQDQLSPILDGTIAILLIHASIKGVGLSQPNLINRRTYVSYRKLTDVSDVRHGHSGSYRLQTTLFRV